MDWAGGASASLTPFGGGSSVCGGVEPRVDGARYKAAVTLDLRNLGKVVEVDKTSRAARIEGGAYGPGAGGPAEAARPDAAAFPAELRIFDARRLDRDALGRPFRQPLHPYRRSRRKPARRDAARRHRDAAAARIGRGPEPGPHVHRLGGHARRHHRGLDAAAGRARHFAPAARSVSSTFFAAARAVRAMSQAGLYPSNCRILDPQEAYNTGAGDGSVGDHGAGLRIRRSSARRLDAARARNAAPITAAPRKPRRAATRISKARPASGATPSSACPMRASS